MKWTKEQVDAELRKIQQSVPQLLRKKVVSEQMLTPDIAFVIDKAIEDPNFDPEKKKKLIALKEEGHFNKKVLTENAEIARQINNYVNREINKAIKEGRLPTKKQFKELGLDYDKTKVR